MNQETNQMEMNKVSKKVKKPMNAFFVYRKQMRQKITQVYQVTKSQEISKIAGQAWAMEPDHVKKYYYRMALVEQMQKEQEQMQIMSPNVMLSPVSQISVDETCNAWSLMDPVFEPATVSKDIQLACSAVDYGYPSPMCEPEKSFDQLLTELFAI
ncbi:hypothetical protein HDV02_005521 [Globomyces sp. JEL0801]|nr:hypothetical protein HDV02_005521 [Globomyces sp. JEL0801]